MWLGQESLVSYGRLHHGQVKMGLGMERALSALHYSLTPISLPVAIIQVNTTLLVVLTTRYYVVSIGE